MKSIKILLFLGTLAAIFLSSGCQLEDPSKSNIPWARPASWENSGPSMKF